MGKVNKYNNYFKRLYDSYVDKNDVKLKYIKFLYDFVEMGQEEFNYTISIFGEEKEKKYDITTILKFTNGYFLAKKFLAFKARNNFHLLLEGYYYEILYNILNNKKGKLAKGVLGTDLSLLLLLALTYFPQDVGIIGEQLLQFLEYHKQREEQNNYFKGHMMRFFGYSDIVWLSSVVSNYYGNEMLSNKIKSYCSDSINPTYKKAVDNLFETDEMVTLDWVNELAAFHLKNSKSDLTLPFNHEEWQYFPIEIISLLEIRLKHGLDIQFIKNTLLSDFISHLGTNLPIQLDDFTKRLRGIILRCTGM